MTLKIILQIAGAIIAAFLASLTAGEGYHAMAGDGSGSLVTAGMAGAGAAFFAWLAGLPALIQSIIKPQPVDPDHPNLPTNLPLEFSQAIAALYALVRNPRDWVLQMTAVVQCLEVAYVIAAATIKDQAILDLLKQAIALIPKSYESKAPRTAQGEFRAAVSGVPTFEELLSK